MALTLPNAERALFAFQLKSWAAAVHGAIVVGLAFLLVTITLGNIKVRIEICFSAEIRFKVETCLLWKLDRDVSLVGFKPAAFRQLGESNINVAFLRFKVDRSGKVRDFDFPFVGIDFHIRSQI